MASLTGQSIANTYDSLLKLTDNEPLTSSLKTVTDGLGNSSVLQLSTLAATFTGQLNLDRDISWNNNTGYGLLSVGGVRFLSYTLAGGVNIGTGAVGVTVGSALSGTSATFSGNGAFGTTSGNLEVGYGATQGLYKLDVNGTGRFSGALTGTSATFSSTITSSRIGIGIVAQSNTGLYVAGDITTGTSQYGLVMDGELSGSTQSIGIRSTLKIKSSAAVTTGAGIRVTNTELGAGASLTTNYGLLIDDQTVGGTDYAIYTGAGAVRFGDALTGTSATFSGAGAILGTAKFGTHDGSNLYSFERYAVGAPNAQMQAGSADNNVAVGFDFLTRIADGSQIIALNLAGTGEALFSSTITTGAPSGGTARPFKVGSAASVSPTSPNRTIEIEINGTTYYLAAKTTND